ncbi:hypothetical protein Tco_0652587 [Tanacetum coccineum]|uniref:Uncharacterized protein n=1 Tax=Tanacetum coccineum TaxID=301880 RepID=A0ABQ4WYB7_9ASTR
MLDELGLGNDVLLFSHFKILGESFDEGLVPLIGDEYVLTLLKYVPKFIEIKVYVEVDVSLVKQYIRKVMSGKGKGVVIEEIVEDDVLDEQHMREGKGKGVVIEEIMEDDGLAEDTNVYTPLVPSSTDALDFHDLLRNIDFEFGIECDKMMEKVSQDNVIAEEVEDDDDSMSDMEGDYLENFSGGESDLHRFFEDDDVNDDKNINGMEGDWILDPYHDVDDGEEHIQDLFYELEQAYKDVVEKVIDPVIYEEVGDEDVVEQRLGKEKSLRVWVSKLRMNLWGKMNWFTMWLLVLRKNLIERSDSRLVITESIRKRKRSNQDEIFCGFTPIGSQRKGRRLNEEEVGGKDIFDDVP